MPSTTLNMTPYSVRSRRLTYLAQCAGSVVAAFDSLVSVLVGTSVPGAPALLTDFLAQAYEQFLPAGASTQAQYTAAQLQAAAMFQNSPLVKALYNLGPGVAVPSPVFPTGNNPPTPSTGTLPANFTTQAAVSAATDEGPIRVFVRNSAQNIPTGGAFTNNGPAQAAAFPAAGGAIFEWGAYFNQAASPGQAQLNVQAPTALGAAHAASPSACFIDVVYGASIAGE